MWKYFKQFGLVLDIFVPQKLSTLGKPFGFVWYKEVKDVNKLLKDIRSVAIGPDLIFINEAKYKRSTLHAEALLPKVRGLLWPLEAAA